MRKMQRMTTKRVSATELQRKTREVIDQVRTSGKAVVVESHGKPMVAVVPFEQYERERKARERDFEALFAFARENARLNPDLTEESAIELADQIRKELRARDRAAKQ
jgi:prevent-host-death family protein